MKCFGYLSLAAVVAGVAVTAYSLQVQAEPTRVEFPDLDALVHYTTVRRGNVTEHIMTSPEAIEAVRQGEPIPNGTQFVLVDYRDEMELYRYFVMEKGEGWGADYDERRRTGDWQFQWFWPDRSVNMSENTARCQACHASQAGADYLFTGYRIPRFDGTPVE
ncbi:cytochrome P460 family protein [Aureimonas altamirensis]|uniref:cytochrome P460 family protein n=1 Tax=Aureimonas altamirensis TaxID=370622 RepID=UPI001E48829B|nr:cytochrome P460 family protein [Aureimonas altamirensis]UHD46406.1 cytochrome P460 family protein [Aureimonas altamirensis]